MIICLFYWGVNLFVSNKDLWILLYYVVKKNYKGVCLKFLEYEVWFDVCDKKGVMFYIFVYEVGNDDIVVMLIICMMN